MDFKDLVIGFVTSFLSVFLSAVVVTYLWSLAAHGIGRVNWETAVQLAIILGITFSITLARDGRNKQR